MINALGFLTAAAAATSAATPPHAYPHAYPVVSRSASRSASPVVSRSAPPVVSHRAPPRDSPRHASQWSTLMSIFGRVEVDPMKTYVTAPKPGTNAYKELMIIENLLIRAGAHNKTRRSANTFPLFTHYPNTLLVRKPYNGARNGRNWYHILQDGTRLHLPYQTQRQYHEFLNEINIEKIRKKLENKFKLAVKNEIKFKTMKLKKDMKDFNALNITNKDIKNFVNRESRRPKKPHHGNSMRIKS